MSPHKKTTMDEKVDETDRALLDFIQDDLPEEAEPFSQAAQGCGISQEELLGRLERLLREGCIRRISALLDLQRLGYRSTLVAVKTPEDVADAVAERISAHPGVGHNYLREGEYNIWFTLTIPGRLSHEREVERLLAGSGAEDAMLLPSLRRYKLRVHLPTGSPPPEAPVLESSPAREGSEAAPESGAVGIVAPELDKTDERLLEVMQEPFPLLRRPWEDIGRPMGINGGEVLRRVGRLKSLGVVRRISGVLHHRRAGYSANGMACFQLAADNAGQTAAPYTEGRKDEAGRIAAGFAEVSHCYLRDVPARFPFPLFAMIHARDRESCRQTASRIAEAIEVQDYRLLFSTKEYKKVRITYKREDI
ncbi:MAG: hypothetical protein R6V67_02025 [Spirochaetia bacterium]